jgi:hypothetical protein
MTLAAPPREASVWGEGQPDGVGSVQDGVIVVRLSFAHAEGRNYRQLPDRARLREKPSPADIVYFKRYSVSELDVSGRMSFLGTGVQSRRLLRVCYAD